ncbi:type II toxin-antitoxin system RelE family toxin [Dyadobacter fanqingshengii]|uniref:Type II toxin-antitoxin system RelE/ParE family toxin n=1 Tax=Dyadobacter fanqingshengii TaxID=2906443 RepID=A0A9X1P7X0_9BACT|nr:type II toxin-antitoxin system RelE/ParE family toxin [Dyadobacter fanqingshengii]MCF0040016.1 type II toxin-antitoxin system RelE/ParE family toxin [Dyadobacter fanqingshengii]USJ38232.1 type II toxin-antitoxin system RelE/ParE family toxin [Dyadobacter fanqingshengii]
MKYKIELTHTAEKFLQKLSKRNYELVVRAVYSLADDPYQPGAKKLKGVDNTFRIRAGNFRILYNIDGGKLIVAVMDIGDRKDIYN